MFGFLFNRKTQSDAEAGFTRPQNAFALLDDTYEYLASAIKPGITTQRLEQLIERKLARSGANLYFKGYHGYPSIISLPVNDEVVHTPPSSRVLRDGDLLKVEFGLEFRSKFAFLGWTFPVGTISEEDSVFLYQTRSALERGIEAAQLAARTGDISSAIHEELKSHGLEPNRDFVGYRIGSKPAMDPKIPAFSENSRSWGAVLQEGMTLAILVIAHRGSSKVYVPSPRWGVKSVDGSRSACFSALVNVTCDGPLRINEQPTANVHSATPI